MSESYSDREEVLRIMHESGHGVAFYETATGDMEVDTVHDDGSQDTFTSLSGSEDDIEAMRELIAEVARLRAELVLMDKAAIASVVQQAQIECAAIARLTNERDEARRIARELYEGGGTFDLCAPASPDWLVKP